IIFQKSLIPHLRPQFSNVGDSSSDPLGGPPNGAQTPNIRPFFRPPPTPSKPKLLTRQQVAPSNRNCYTSATNCYQKRIDFPVNLRDTPPAQPCATPLAQPLAQPLAIHVAVRVGGDVYGCVTNGCTKVCDKRVAGGLSKRWRVGVVYWLLWLEIQTYTLLNVLSRTSSTPSW